MGEFAASFQIVELIHIFDVVALKVKNCKVLEKSNIKELIDIVIAYV